MIQLLQICLDKFNARQTGPLHKRGIVRRNVYLLRKQRRTV